jgi:DeoR/GlpR family transcriptional regulator of sugar metabolism
MTNFLTYQERLDYLLQLVTHGNTGSPSSLANRFGVSKRTIKRIIDVLRLKGYNISYCRKRETYHILTN